MSAHRIAEGRRVLVVEDEMLILLDIEDALRALGAEVIETAARLDTAMRLAKESAIDIAFLDVHIQGGNTFSVADILALRGIPFAFCTGYSEWSIEERHSHRPRVTKPYSSKALEEQVRQLLSAQPGQ
ncbi:MAG: response regulator [Pseudomonadota bacterium]|nr:response regulator [Pseudomonadota bacterium]